MKRSFVLLEVLIAFVLLSLFAFSIIHYPISILRSSLKNLQAIEYDTLLSQAATDLTLRIDPTPPLSSCEKDAELIHYKDVEVKIKNFPLQRGAIYYKLWGKDKAKDDHIHRLTTLKLFLFISSKEITTTEHKIYSLYK